MLADVKVARNAARDVLDLCRRVTKAATFGQDVFVDRMADVVDPMLAAALEYATQAEVSLDTACKAYTALTGKK